MTPSFRNSKFLLSAFFAVVVMFVLAVPSHAASTLEISSPSQNQKLDSDQVIVTWKLTGTKLVDYAKNTKNRIGKGHLHLWLDENNPIASNAVKVVSGTSYTFLNIKSGQHALIVELENNDHSPAKPQVKQTINFQTAAPFAINPNIPQNDMTLFLILVAIILIGALWYFLAPEPAPISPTAPKRQSSRKPSPKRKH